MDLGVGEDVGIEPARTLPHGSLAVPRYVTRIVISLVAMMACRPIGWQEAVTVRGSRTVPVGCYYRYKQ